MLSLSCLDTGARVIESDSECNYVARGMTEEELWKDATEHIVKAHGMKIEDFLKYVQSLVPFLRSLRLRVNLDVCAYSPLRKIMLLP